MYQKTIVRFNKVKGNKKSHFFKWLFEGGDEWARTTDSRIFSPMLYQLSYITVLSGAKVCKNI